MIIDFAICWYALGWATCGLGYAVDVSFRNEHIKYCLTYGPIIGVFLLGSLIFDCLDLSESKQYFWRKP